MENSNRVVITVVGKDKTGIIAKVSTLISDHNVNILDISQTILQEFFTMIMVVDTANCTVDFATLKQELDQLGEQVGVVISCQHEDIFQFMHRI